jgi:hypothetical protein
MILDMLVALGFAMVGMLVLGLLFVLASVVGRWLRRISG